MTNDLLITGQWSETRFSEVKDKLGPFLKTCGYKEKDLIFLPISALQGANIKAAVPSDVCPWWNKGSLFDVS